MTQQNQFKPMTALTKRNVMIVQAFDLRRNPDAASLLNLLRHQAMTNDKRMKQRRTLNRNVIKPSLAKKVVQRTVRFRPIALSLVYNPMNPSSKLSRKDVKCLQVVNNRSFVFNTFLCHGLSNRRYCGRRPSAPIQYIRRSL